MKLVESIIIAWWPATQRRQRCFGRVMVRSRSSLLYISLFWRVKLDRWQRIAQPGLAPS